MKIVNLFHLKYFVDAAQEGGLSPSARKNYVTQSAVSRAIASLEQDLGVELVVHRKNRFQLTEAGEAVWEKSQAIFDSVTNLKDSASEHSNMFRGPLRLGCNQAVAAYMVAPALTRMESNYPQILPKIKLGNTDQIQHMLDRREIDFGIVVDDGQVMNLYQTRKIYTDKLLVVRAPHFKREPFKNLIVSRVQKGGLSQRYFREYEKVYGVRLTPKLVVPSWQVILGFALAGYGAALVPRFLCEEALRSKTLEIVKHRVQPVSFDLCTIISKNRDLPKNARAFLESLV